MRYYVGNGFYGEDLVHHGTKGMKRGVRRYQNPDGSLTDEGYAHYGRNKPKKKRGLFGLEKKRKPAPRKKQKVIDEETIERGKAKWKTSSDEKLREATGRIKLENDYLRAKKDQKELTTRKKEKKELSTAGKIVLENVMKTINNVLVEYTKASSKDS